VVDNIDAEVEQVFAVLFLGGDEGTDIQFEFVEHGFVHDAVTVDEMTEENK
jgi:fructose-1-phosphate kinase PfkB-like protein